ILSRHVGLLSIEPPSPGRPVTAIILAAGVARRLAPLSDHTQKSLLPVGGRPILAWMLRTLHAVGVRRAVIVVGHCADQVEAVAAAAPAGLTAQCLHNPDYQKGSSLSLLAARDVIGRHPSLIMDADVVFPAEFLRRLVGCPAPNALLIDRGFTDTGEEVKIYTQGDRVIALGKKVVPRAWDRVGEGVGFFKCGAADGPELLRLLEQVVEESGGLCEYEDALHLFVGRQPVHAVDVTGLPWTEVDFVDDLRRAQEEVFPAVARLENA
ncbi:MAG TPA: phosphocholine cytidylyltransferase family protein, partial [Candidatus Methylomirabilis sp.]|nr:phosphocholine cytidylyltransferase family protein [Candidatus Methylomirabilis sp.]